MRCISKARKFISKIETWSNRNGHSYFQIQSNNPKKHTHNKQYYFKNYLIQKKQKTKKEIVVASNSDAHDILLITGFSCPQPKVYCIPCPIARYWIIICNSFNLVIATQNQNVLFKSFHEMHFNKQFAIYTISPGFQILRFTPLKFSSSTVP